MRTRARIFHLKILSEAFRNAIDTIKKMPLSLQTPSAYPYKKTSLYFHLQ